MGCSRGIRDGLLTKAPAAPKFPWADVSLPQRRQPAGAGIWNLPVRRRLNTFGDQWQEIRGLSGARGPTRLPAHPSGLKPSGPVT